LVSQEVRGLGFALACDYLKELGYVNFAKPDVHLRDIFCRLGLCTTEADDYTLFKAIVRIAKHAEVPAYRVDKLFWLIGNGNFYEHSTIGKNGKIGSHKEEFIASVLEQMKA
jgi:thermostable 8-oxoguanine DNA glycosylase